MDPHVGPCWHTHVAGAQSVNIDVRVPMEACGCRAFRFERVSSKFLGLQCIRDNASSMCLAYSPDMEKTYVIVCIHVHVEGLAMLYLYV